MELNCSGRKILVTVRMGKKQTYKNLVFNILAFVVQFVTSFYISPIIVSGVGASAYGFIGLANDFISYAGIITSVFNSVAARFIANSYYKKDFDASRCNNFHGNVAARMNSINANKDTFKMYTDMFLTEYIILAIHLNSQGALSDVVLNKVKKNANLMI